MLIIGMILALGLFIYFQQRISNRNMEKFERSREKYEKLLEQLRERDKDSNEGSKEDS